MRTLAEWQEEMGEKGKEDFLAEHLEPVVLVVSGEKRASKSPTSTKAGVWLRSWVRIRPRSSADGATPAGSPRKALCRSATRSRR